MRKASLFVLMIFVATVLISPYFSFAASSESYKIDADVLGVGGNAGTSESFKLTDTIGEPNLI